MADWPTTFPSPLVSRWSLQPAPLTIRSEMEAGADRVRRVSQQRNDRVGATWVMSLAQFAEFRTWFSSEALDGAAWFNIALQTGQSALCEESASARFVGSWTANALNSKYIQVTATLEVR